MIGAGDPERSLAVHAGIADHDVLQRASGVADVQRPVTFGGGSTIENGSASGAVTPFLIQMSGFE